MLGNKPYTKKNSCTRTGVPRKKDSQILRKASINGFLLLDIKAKAVARISPMTKVATVRKRVTCKHVKIGLKAA
jgi:hypothetical protein